jgi:CRP-like cAMP-binding protein
MSLTLLSNCISCPAKAQSTFSDIPDHLLVELSKLKVMNTYKKGQTIFYEGNKPYGVYCISSGKVKLSKISAEGKELIVKLSKPGDLLGYRSFFTNEFYSSTAEVIEDTRICFIDRDKFYELIKNHPPYSLKLLALMGQEIKCAENNSASMAYKSTNERMAEVILTLKETYGVKENNEYKIDIQLSRNDLAGLTGTSVETSVRLLTWLKEKGFVETRKKFIYITNLEGLQALVPEF